MSVRSILFALALAGSVAFAADKPPKPPKAPKHAVHTPKSANHSKQAAKGVVHKSPKVAKHKVSTPKIAKHKTTKFQKRKA
jgi:hypothetical protein